MSIKVTFLIPGFSDGGAQRQCILLLNAMQEDPDIDVRLIHFYDGVHIDMLKRERINVQRFDSTSNYDPRNLWHVWKALKKDPPHVLMTWLHACDVYGYFLARLLPDICWVMTERDSAYPNELRYNIRRRLGRHADLIVANSFKGSSYWEDAGAVAKIFTVPNIVLKAAAAEQLYPTIPRVITIGRLERQKNPATVVSAFTILAKENPSLEFAVIGAGSEEAALRNIASREGMYTRIAFLGFRKDVPEQLARSNLVVSMSNNEGLPNVLLESVAAGRIAVVSDILEHRELFGPDYPFYVMDRANPAAVAEAVNRALNTYNDISPLKYARSRLNNMTPDAVLHTYKCIFRHALELQK